MAPKPPGARSAPAKPVRSSNPVRWLRCCCWSV